MHNYGTLSINKLTATNWKAKIDKCGHSAHGAISWSFLWLHAAKALKIEYADTNIEEKSFMKLTAQ